MWFFSSTKRKSQSIGVLIAVRYLWLWILQNSSSRNPVCSLTVVLPPATSFERECTLNYASRNYFDLRGSTLLGADVALIVRVSTIFRLNCCKWHYCLLAPHGCSFRAVNSSVPFCQCIFHCWRFTPENFFKPDYERYFKHNSPVILNEAASVSFMGAFSSRFFCFWLVLCWT